MVGIEDEQGRLVLPSVRALEEGKTMWRPLTLCLSLAALTSVSCGGGVQQVDEGPTLGLGRGAAQVGMDELSFDDEAIESLYSPCAEKPALEQPIGEGTIGDGDRFVQIENGGASEVRVRLLDGSGAPAIEGTLRIEPMSAGRFTVPVGTYQLRFRDEASCQVVRGDPFTLTEDFEGAFVSIEFVYEDGVVRNLMVEPGPL